MLQRLFINKTLVYRYLLFSERSLKMVSQNPVKKKKKEYPDHVIVKILISLT